MSNNGNKMNCEFENEIVSYIYDEMGMPERTKFETHLANCSLCTDEFASISNARFSVFEWQKEEFAHLATPEIILPHAPQKRVVEETSTAGVLAGLRGWLTLVKLPVTVAAAIALSIGLGFLAIIYLGTGDLQVASVEIKDQSAAPSVAVDDPPIIETKVARNAPEMVVTSSATNNVRHQIQPIKASSARRPRFERQTTADNQITINADRNAMPKIRKAPALSNFDDNDDNSLRLADLFEEFGG